MEEKLVQVHCPRCAKLATRAESATDITWNCPAHGVVKKEQKPAPEPAAEVEAGEVQPGATDAATGSVGAGPRALNGPAATAGDELPEPSDKVREFKTFPLGDAPKARALN